MKNIFKRIALILPAAAVISFSFGTSAFAKSAAHPHKHDHHALYLKKLDSINASHYDHATKLRLRSDLAHKFGYSQPVHHVTQKSAHFTKKPRSVKRFHKSPRKSFSTNRFKHSHKSKHSFKSSRKFKGHAHKSPSFKSRKLQHKGFKTRRSFKY